MANEISLTFNLQVKNPASGGGFSDGWVSGSLQFNQAGVGEQAGVQSIPTTAAGTTLTVGAVSTLGWAVFENLDTTNYVELGVQVAGTFYPFARLLAGEQYPLRLSPSATVYARANTAAVQLQYKLFQN